MGANGPACLDWLLGQYKSCKVSLSTLGRVCRSRPEWMSERVADRWVDSMVVGGDGVSDWGVRELFFRNLSDCKLGELLGSGSFDVWCSVAGSPAAVERLSAGMRERCVLSRSGAVRLEVALNPAFSREERLVALTCPRFLDGGFGVGGTVLSGMWDDRARDAVAGLGELSEQEFWGLVGSPLFEVVVAALLSVGKVPSVKLEAGRLVDALLTHLSGWESWGPVPVRVSSMWCDNVRRLGSVLGDMGVLADDGFKVPFGAVFPVHVDTCCSAEVYRRVLTDLKAVVEDQGRLDETRKSGLPGLGDHGSGYRQSAYNTVRSWESFCGDYPHLAADPAVRDRALEAMFVSGWEDRGLGTYTQRQVWLKILGVVHPGWDLGELVGWAEKFRPSGVGVETVSEVLFFFLAAVDGRDVSGGVVTRLGELWGSGEDVPGQVWDEVAASLPAESRVSAFRGSVPVGMLACRDPVGLVSYLERHWPSVRVGLCLDAALSYDGYVDDLCVLLLDGR